MDKLDQIRTAILEMLLDDDESAWVLHTQLTEEFPDISVSVVLSLVKEMEQRGWISAWVPNWILGDSRSIDDYAREAQKEYERWVESGSHYRAVFQEFGPWFTITPAGKKTLAARSSADEHTGRS